MEETFDCRVPVSMTSFDHGRRGEPAVSLSFGEIGLRSCKLANETRANASDEKYDDHVVAMCFTRVYMLQHHDANTR